MKRPPDPDRGRIADVEVAYRLAHNEQLARTLPPGGHPADIYIWYLVQLLGRDKAAMVLGIPWEDR